MTPVFTAVQVAFYWVGNAGRVRDQESDFGLGCPLDFQVETSCWQCIWEFGDQECSHYFLLHYELLQNIEV